MFVHWKFSSIERSLFTYQRLGTALYQLISTKKKKKIKEACILIICTVQPRIRDHHTFNLQGAIKDHHMFTLWTDFCKMKRGIMLSDNFNTSHLIKRRIPMLKRLLYYDKLGGKFNLMYAALPSRRHRFWDINFGPRMQT